MRRIWRKPSDYNRDRTLFKGRGQGVLKRYGALFKRKTSKDLVFQLNSKKYLKFFIKKAKKNQKRRTHEESSIAHKGEKM